MKADYVVTSPGFGQGSIPLDGAEQLAGQLPNVTSASGIRSGQAKIDGSVDQVIAADPAKIDSLFDLQPKQGKISRARRRTASRCSTPPPSDKGWKLGSKVPIDVRADRHAAVHGRVDLHADRLHQLRDHAPTRTQKNFTDQFDFQVYVNTKGGVTPANTAAIKKVMHQYPGPKVETRDEYKAIAGRADQPVPQPGLRAAVLRHRHRPVRHRQHARPVDHRTPSRARACCARSA